MQNTKLNNNDYEILKEVYTSAPAPLQEQLIKLSCWNLFDVIDLQTDVTLLESDRGNISCLVDGKKSTLQINDDIAQQGDIIYIISDKDIHRDYIGNYYLVSGISDIFDGQSKAYLLAHDSFNNNQEYIVSFDKEEYITFSRTNITNNICN